MKPYLHAKASVKRYGGKIEDYLPIHDFLDSSKSSLADARHRAILHSSFGVFIVEKIFGHIITNSAGKEVSVRDLAEEHVVEDLGMIPSVHKWLEKLPVEDWMISRQTKTKKFIPMEESISVANTDGPREQVFNVTVHMVKELRERTGAGIMDCKTALQETEGSMDQAADLLRARDLSKKATTEEDPMNMVIDGGRSFVQGDGVTIKGRGNVLYFLKERFIDSKGEPCWWLTTGSSILESNLNDSSRY